MEWNQLRQKWRKQDGGDVAIRRPENGAMKFETVVCFVPLNRIRDCWSALCHEIWNCGRLCAIVLRKRPTVGFVSWKYDCWAEMPAMCQEDDCIGMEPVLDTIWVRSKAIWWQKVCIWMRWLSWGPAVCWWTMKDLALQCDLLFQIPRSCQHSRPVTIQGMLGRAGSKHSTDTWIWTESQMDLVDLNIYLWWAVWNYKTVTIKSKSMMCTCRSEMNHHNTLHTNRPKRLFKDISLRKATNATSVGSCEKFNKNEMRSSTISYAVYSNKQESASSLIQQPCSWSNHSRLQRLSAA